MMLADTYRASEGRCVYCMRPADTIDHVDPNGPHDRENLVAACRSCNAAKGARTPQQWREDIAAYGGRKRRK